MGPLSPFAWLACGLFMASQTQVLRVGAASEAPRERGFSVRQQTLSVEALTMMVKKELATALPVGMQMLHVVPEKTAHVAEGSLKVTLAFDEPLRPGLQNIRAEVHSSGQIEQIPVRLALSQSAVARSTPIISRGAEVLVVVRSGNVMVQALGITQEAGAAGERIRVLPTNSPRIVHGTVIDSRTVEVGL